MMFIEKYGTRMRLAMIDENSTSSSRESQIKSHRCVVLD
jgi:hypothetical protein